LSLSKNRCGRAIIPPLATVYAIGALIYVTALLLHGHVRGLATDHGPIQLTNLAILVGLIGLAAYRAWAAGSGQRTNLGLLTYCMFFYAAREGDLHQIEYYPEHLANRRFYQSAEIPVLDKVLVGTLLLTLVIAAVILLIRVFPFFVKALKRHEDWAVYALFWFGTLVLTQISDHSFLNGKYYGVLLEEVGELTAAGIATLILWHFPTGGGRLPVDET